MNRALARRLGSFVPAAPASEATPLCASIPLRPYTVAEWEHFTHTRILLERDGEAAARAWLARHPRPANVPAWLLARESQARLLAPHLSNLPDLSPGPQHLAAATAAPSQRSHELHTS